jgi:hypothetical protein
MPEGAFPDRSSTHRITRMAAALLTALLPATASPETTAPPLTFTPDTETEDRFVFRDDRSGFTRGGDRFLDATSHVIYALPFRRDTIASVTLCIENEFTIGASDEPSASSFVSIADFRDHGDGRHRVVLTLDLTSFTRKHGTVYLKIGDGKPDDGCGGRIVEMQVDGPLTGRPAVRRIADIKPIFHPLREGLYPRLPTPSPRLAVFPIGGLPFEEQLLFTSLQGLANREKPRLFLRPHPDALDLLTATGAVRSQTVLAGAGEVFKAFPYRDAVVTDPALYGSENVAAIVAGAEGLVIASPALIGKYGLNTKVDLRGRWKRTVDAYRAMYAKYEARLNRSALAMIGPGRRCRIYDYVVAHRLFPFWITGPDDASRPGADRWAERDWFEEILSKDFPVNIPVLGYPGADQAGLPSHGIGENRGVALLSRCGKFLVPSDWIPNLTVLTALPAARPASKPAPPRPIALDRTKVYASLLLSDGDNLCVWNGRNDLLPRYIRALDTERNYPVAVTLGPSLVDLYPPMAEWAFNAIRSTDGLGCAVTGVGYIYPGQYARNFGSARPRVVREYLDLTSRYMSRCGQNWLWAMSYGSPRFRSLKDLAFLAGTRAIVHGYGREAMRPQEAVTSTGPIPVFQSVTRAADAAEVLKDVDAMLGRKTRPLFLHVFLVTLRVGPRDCDAIARDLQAKGCLLVTPVELADLYARYRSEMPERSP